MDPKDQRDRRGPKDQWGQAEQGQRDRPGRPDPREFKARQGQRDRPGRPDPREFKASLAL